MALSEKKIIFNNGGSEIPILSFFSGAGLLDIGFLRTGNFSIPWHNECHEPFARAYEYGVSRLGFNAGGKRTQNRSKIENLRAPAVLDQAFGDQKPKMFGVIGGPPCPDFSRAGKNLGRDGKNGKLTRNFSNIILNLHPKFFVLENVPGLLETKKHRQFLFALLKKLGRFYTIDLRVLNALEYGVPQNRRRVFVVGICSKWLKSHYPKTCRTIISKGREIINLDVSEKINSKDMAINLARLSWFSWPHQKFPNAKTAYSWGIRGCAPDELQVGHQFSKINGHPNAHDIFHPYSTKFQIIKAGDTSRKSFKRLHRYRYSPNVAYGNNEVHLHPTKQRRISVAEALTLQSAPSEYAFPCDMTLTDKFKAVSNGVPVLLAENMATAIIKFLTEKET